MAGEAQDLGCCMKAKLEGSRDACPSPPPDRHSRSLFADGSEQRGKVRDLIRARSRWMRKPVQALGFVNDCETTNQQWILRA